MLALVAVVAVVVAVALLTWALRARADRRLDAALQLVLDELEPLTQRLRRAVEVADEAQARGVREHEVALDFPELEQDELTGVRSRSGYEADLEREIQKARRTGNPLSLLLLDLRTAGAAAERRDHDRLLRELAALLQRLTRSTDTVFRRSEEELGILLPETPAEGARRFHGRVWDEVARGAFGPYNPMTFSVGLVEWRPDETSESFDARASASVGPLRPPAELRPPKTR